MSLNILLVDDHRMFREGLVLLLGREVPEAKVVGEVGTAAAAFECARALRPDLIVMDVHLPDRDGLTTSAQILAEIPGSKIIILSAEPNLGFVKQALRMGVSGYLLKDGASAELASAIRTVQKGACHLCHEINELVLEDYRRTLANADDKAKPTLSAREQQVLRFIGDGLRTKEIADRMGVGIKTAETYRQRLLAKLGCKGTAELIRHAVREGLLQP